MFSLSANRIFRALLGTEVARSEPPHVPTRDPPISWFRLAVWGGAVLFAAAVGWVVWYLVFAPLPAPQFGSASLTRVDLLDDRVAVGVDVEIGELTPVCCLQCYLDLEVTLELLDAAGTPVPMRPGRPCPSNRQFCVEADPDAEQTSQTKDFRDPGRDNEVFGLSFLYWPNVALPTPKARVRVLDRLADKETVQTIELPARL